MSRLFRVIPSICFRGPWIISYKGAFNNYVDKMGGGGQKMSVFVHAQGIKTVHKGGGGGQKVAKFCPRSC